MAAEMNEHNPHIWWGPGYHLTYWRGNIASDHIDATHGDLSRPGIYPMTVMTFRFPQDQALLDAMQTFLQSVYDSGRMAKAAEIREALGVDAGRR